MSLLLLLIGLCVLAMSLISIVDVIRRHDSAASLIGWIALIVILPFVGSLIYWAMRKPSRAEVEQHYLADEDLRREQPGQPFDRTGF